MVIKFKENGHVDEYLLTKEEMNVFVAFLLAERSRHIDDIIAIDKTLLKLSNRYFGDEKIG